MKRLLVLLCLARTAAASPILGDPAPALDLQTLDGKTIALKAFAGKVVVVEFFGTWCGFCERAAADLDALHHKLGGRFQILLVDVAETRATVQKYLVARPLPEGAVIVLDPKGQAAQRWGQKRFPTTFLVDEQGVIRHIDRGYGPGYLNRVARWLAGMLTKLA